MEILLSPPFVDDVVLKAFFVCFLAPFTDLIDFILVRLWPHFLPAQLHDILAVFLSGLPFLPIVIKMFMSHCFLVYY